MSDTKGSTRELANWLREQNGVHNVEAKSVRSDGSRYVAADVQLAGLDLHDLHDEMDVQIRSAYHDPSTGRLRYAIWHESEVEGDA